MSIRHQDLVDLESMFVTQDGAGIRLTGEQCDEIAKAIAEFRLGYLTVLNRLGEEIAKNRLIMIEVAGQATPGVIAIFPERRRQIVIEGEVLSLPAGGAA